MTPEQLWKKYAKGEYSLGGCISKADFTAAIKEAMQAQRKRDAEICRDLHRKGYSVAVGGVYGKIKRTAHPDDCAAAIEREPIA